MAQAWRVWVRGCSVLSLALTAGNCSNQSGGTDTRTNWLAACDRSVECGGELACLCGVCTISCQDSAACAGFGDEAECLAVDGCRGVVALCGSPELAAVRAEGESTATSAPDAAAASFTSSSQSDERDSDAPSNNAPSSDSNHGDSTHSDATHSDGTYSNATHGDSIGLSAPTGATSSDSSVPVLTSDEPTESRPADTSAADTSAGSTANEQYLCQPGEPVSMREACPTGVQTRECVSGKWVDLCTSCERITLADPALEDGIRIALGKPTGDLTRADAAKLTSLNVNGLYVESLSGLECFTSLYALDLSMNSISDLEPLAQLSLLTELGLSNNRITDLTPLSTISTLGSLWIAGNTIEDVTPLAALPNVWGLELSSNEIADLTPLQNLTTLDSLSVSFNPVTSIQALAGLTNLRTLSVGPNPAFDGDLSPLTGFTRLEMLQLPECGLEDAELGPLSDLASLQYLSLDGNEIVDVAALSEYSDTTLSLHDNPLDCDGESLRLLQERNLYTLTDCP